MDNLGVENQIAVKLRGVKKRYKLGQIGGGTLTADIQSWWARIRGKEDPNTKIGEDQRLSGTTFMALNGIDLTIYQGEAVGIIGGNGAGKSTLLKLLSRVTGPTEGEIDIYGRITSMLEVGTGFNGEMTGRENVYMNGAILGMTKAEIDAKMDEIIEFSEVSDFIDTPVKRYSSGMYVKLAFSVAAHLDSEIMIMDEVLAVGDINFQQKCLTKMREAAKTEGRTVLYVSHNMNTIRQLCDRCIVLNQGKVVYDGDVEEAINVYAKRNDVGLSQTYNLSEIRRTSTLPDFCRLKAITIENPEIDLGDKLKCCLSILSKKDINQTLMRLVFFEQTGNRIGTSYSQAFPLKKGENKINISFDTQGIMQGKYYVDIILFEYDGKMQIRHDLVSKAFGFLLQEGQEIYNMKWNTNAWGSIRLSDTEVCI